MKKLIVFLLIIAVSISTCSIYSGGAVYTASNVPLGYEKVAQTKNLILYFNLQNNAIMLEDKRNGYIWKSVVDNSIYDLSSTNDNWKNYMTSMFAFEYTKSNSNSSTVQKAFLISEPHNVKVAKISGGLLLAYDFTDINIEIGLEIKLDGDSAIVKVPIDKIRENGENKITGIELMPFFGAADRKVDGYIMYPDGCGALMRYQNIEKRKSSTKSYIWYAYGPEKVNIDEYLKMENLQKFQAMLPIFGVKNGNNAFIALASEGEGDTSINLSPEGNVVNLNRIFFKFTYRYFFETILSNITVNGGNVTKNNTGTKVDRDIIKHDHEVRYLFLEGSNANYSGMANAYRDYLVSNNALRDIIKKDSNIPLAIDLFMGIKEDRLLFDKYIAMTDFKQAELLTDRLIKNGIKDIQVKLIGWTKGGYGLYPVNWPPETALGGTKGLENYIRFTGKNNVKLFLQTNFINAKSKNGGFSKRDDVVIQGNKLPVTDSKEEEFLLNPVTANNRLISFMKNFSRYGSGGIALEGIGKLVYHDYNKNNPSGRIDTTELWKKMLEFVGRQSDGVAVEGGNAYVLKYAERLFNIPTMTSNYYINDETIPFYQMVVHGMIPYSSEAANLFHDSVKQKLKCVEYGCMPYYELTYQSSKKLKNSEYNKLFTSYYADWTDSAAEVYKDFNNRLKEIWSEKMVWHEKVREELYKVIYSNNIIVYVNYSYSDTQCDGFRIKGQDYLVVNKRGEIR